MTPLHHHITPLLATTLAGLALTASLHAQCQQWSPLGGGTSGAVRALAVFDGQIHAGGSFVQASGTTVNRVARWSGAAWEPLGTEPDIGITVGGPNAVRAMTDHDGSLYVAGSFSEVGGVAANNVARWNGSEWSPLSAALGGVSSDVWALAAFDGDLIVAGSFLNTVPTTQPVNNIVRFDGTSFVPFVVDGAAGVNGAVFAATVHDGSLVIAGGFTLAGGVPANRIARWTGSTWEPLGAGFDGGVRALAVHDGELIAGGDFLDSGGTTVNRIARWNGSSWQPFVDDGAVGLNGQVLSLLSYRGDLAVGGAFSLGDGTVGHARWTGNGWTSFASAQHGPLDGAVVLAMMASGDDLVAGGQFTTAGGQPVNNIASWTDGAPHFTSVPSHTVVPPGELVVLAPSLFSTDGVTFRWQRDGVDLTDDGRIVGAQSKTLVIIGTEPGDTGAYTLRAESLCGVSRSAPIVVAVCAAAPSTPCLADLNGDGVVDGADLGMLLQNWGSCAR